MTHIKENIIREYKKLPGTTISWEGKRVDVPLPSESDDSKGQLTMIYPGGAMIFNLIDIRSREIPDIVANPGNAKGEGRVLKINYCVSGRCELRLRDGECTSLTTGEIAVDAGQALNTFYYPTGEYRGFEIAVYLDFLPRKYNVLGECFSSPERIYNLCSQLEHPWIRNAGESISRMHDVFKTYTNEYKNSELLLLKCLEMISLLSQMDFGIASIRRTYCTASQVEIAKKTMKIIMSDLSVRFTARDLAKDFGISETSLKNYFRSVYGCGYAEYQQIARMKKAARLLEDTEDKVAEIGQAVGFATQAKFGAAFKEYFGVTPLEYRRRSRLGEL